MSVAPKTSTPQAAPKTEDVTKAAEPASGTFDEVVDANRLNAELEKNKIKLSAQEQADFEKIRLEELKAHNGTVFGGNIGAIPRNIISMIISLCSKFD